MKTTRQNFLKTSALLGAAAGFPTIIPASVLGAEGKVAPSNKVNIGALSCGRRACSGGAYQDYEKSQIVAICDPKKDMRDARGQNWGIAEKDRYVDFRDLLARDDVDAVSIATPDHWHVPLSMAAAKAGKDVYCEKPLGISIEQNLAARRIENEYNRVFQYGTQQRSMQHMRMGLEIVLNGHIGDVKEVYVWAWGGRAGGDATETPVPEGFDYELWLGPAPVAPYSFDRCMNQHGAYHHYDYSIGFLGGWGAHPLDQLQWWADEEGLGIPYEYQTTGTINYNDLYNTAFKWNMEALYQNGLKLHFMDTDTAWKSKHIPGIDQLRKYGNMTQFIGTNGWVGVSREGLLASSEELRRKAKNPGPRRLPISKNHKGNFVDCVLSRERPIANLDSAIRSDIISHMSDIGIRTGEILKWDPAKEMVIGSDRAKSMMHREMRAPYDRLMI
ncbi:Gfo/Idh/MocA family protein [Pontiella agarivorans]|uniref:Gfo/Idh/MocA family oxidoreductase n=1 Tax=Pontiella agarivorans TaxID=3038953 RepID=A0ABU5MX37_9BACT|nr:Gfo/Idh/MocA family oxidoreductase [Pontiella agarivorans]MDZ8118767.1 Gfo/Idh/MocA family oxidoreductase [Pontiella agarivorans]